jgi:hypothetical protein
MAQEYDIKGMAAKISDIRRDAETLREISGGIPTVDRNVNRILANVRMLEINISDPEEILGK